MGVKRIVAGGLVLATAALGATWYTGTAYQANIEQQMQVLEETYSDLGIVFSHRSLSKSLFGIEDEVSVFLGPEYLANLGVGENLEQAVEFRISNTCQIKPLYVACKNQFKAGNDKASAALAEIIPDIQYSLGWSLNLWQQKLVSHLEVQPFSHEFKGNKLQFSGLTMDLLGNTKLVDWETSMHWQGASFVEANSGNKVTFGRMNLLSKLHQLESTIFTGEMSADLDSYQVQIATGDTLQGKNLSLGYTLTDAGNDKLDLQYKFHHESIDKTGAQDFSLKNLKLDMSVPGMELALWRAFSELSGKKSPQAMEAFMVKVGEYPHQLKLEQLAVEYNTLPMSANGGVKIESFNPSTVKQKLPEILTAEINLLLGAEFTEVFAQLAPMVEQYESLGMLGRTEKGEYQTQLKLANRQLTANGELVQAF